jgi:hypothetical protein
VPTAKPASFGRSARATSKGPTVMIPKPTAAHVYQTRPLPGGNDCFSMRAGYKKAARVCRRRVSGEWGQWAASYASRTAWLIRPRAATSWPFSVALSRIFVNSSALLDFQGVVPVLVRAVRPPLIFRADAM